MIKKIAEAKYIINKENDMKTNAILFLTEKLYNNLEKDAIDQIKNVATLPGIVGNAMAMPDMHSGYGFPIGGVAAFDYETGIVSPGGIGFDINCGVRLIKTNITAKDVDLKEIINEIYNTVPAGVGRDNKEKLDKEEFLEVIIKGIDWAIKQGIATKKDKESIEDYGILNASADYISNKAIKRGRPQLGTLGSGNHFLEIQEIEKSYDKTAEKWGLKEKEITIMIHTGSRGFGHQIASDFIKLFIENQNKFNFKIKDQQLAAVPIHSELGKQYISSMHAAANFAYVNRQMIYYKVKNIFEKYGVKTELIYDVAHNIAKKERYTINGEKKELLIHRKGATRALEKGNKLLPEKYIATGQPVILPGSMGTNSYVLLGTNSESISFGSAAHGSGRIMSRSKALKTLNLEKIEKELKEKNIEVKSVSTKGILEEAPQVYKNVDEVVNALVLNDIAKPIIKLKPLKIIKG